MTYTAKAVTHCSLPIHRAVLVNSIKLYSLFRKEQSGRWQRISDCAYSKKLAYRVFTERLAVNPLQFSIRPIRIESLGAK